MIFIVMEKHITARGEMMEDADEVKEKSDHLRLFDLRAVLIPG